MATGADRLAALSGTQRERLESILLDFDVAWTPNALAERVAELPSDNRDFRRHALLELVKIDLERQWKTGNEVEIEAYMVRFPELGAAATVDPELLLAEHQARELRGRPVKFEDFARRFPSQVKELQQLLNRPGQTTSRRLSHNARTDTSRAGEMVETKGSPAAKSWSLPKEFGRYRLLKPLGEGGMGSVYLARDIELDRQVALKVPKFSGHEDPQLIERFYREARAAAKLQNRHICQVYDVGEIDGVRYISMAYIEGRPLSAYARNDRTQPERSVVLVVGRLARALQEAHALGVVHRDLKPANIMIDRKREPVIMDFGLARLERQEDSRLTQSGMVLGTPAYMAPEQVSGEIERMGPVTDIYSLGVILYELLTGHVPFEGSMAAVLGQIMTQEPPKPSEFRADLGPRLEQICLKMMAKQNEDRYGSMQEVADALADYLKRPVDEGLDDDPSVGAMSASQEDNQQLESMFATRYAKSAAKAVARTERDPTPLPASVIMSRFKHPLAVAAIAVGVLLPIVLGILFLLRTPYGTLRIEAEDPNLRVSVDGENLAIEDPSGSIRLQTGSHRLGVKLGDTVLPIGDAVKLQMAEYDGDHRLEVSLDGATLSSESFTIVKGDNRVISVKLLPLEAAAIKPLAGGESQPQDAVVELDGSPTHHEETPPPLAVAPFGSTQAKQHQRAWADYLGVPVEMTNSIGIKLVLIPPGEFLMGSTEEQMDRYVAEMARLDPRNAGGKSHRRLAEMPQHSVKLTKAFYLGIHGVTRAEFRGFVEATGYKTDAETDGVGGCFLEDRTRWVEDPRAVWSANLEGTQTDDCPVVNVSWNDAVSFCQWLSHKENVAHMLPTEAQWEYACRAGGLGAWCSGDDVFELEQHAWYHDNSGGYIRPAGGRTANGFSIKDMHGNAWEWCADWYDETYYSSTPLADPKGPLGGVQRVYRGGCFNNHAVQCRASLRYFDRPIFRAGWLGFRVAVDLPRR